MKFYLNGGFLYGTVYTVWRGVPRFRSWMATMFYKRVVRECGQGTVFGHGVYIGYPRRISIGDDCLIGSHVVFVSESPLGELTICDGAQISPGSAIDFTGQVTIGRATLLSQGVRILSHDHGYDPRSNPEGRDILIGDNVWIGDSAIILPSTERIGDFAIVGAGSIVTKPVPARSIVAGNPASVIGAQVSSS